MQVEIQGWKGYKDKMPQGDIWASRDKCDGYIRTSILRSLPRRVHSAITLPDFLIEAGGFGDVDTNENADQMAVLELGIRLRRECRKKVVDCEDDDQDSSYEESDEE